MQPTPAAEARAQVLAAAQAAARRAVEAAEAVAPQVAVVLQVAAVPPAAVVVLAAEAMQAAVPLERAEVGSTPDRAVAPALRPTVEPARAAAAGRATVACLPL